MRRREMLCVVTGTLTGCSAIESGDTSSPTEATTTQSAIDLPPKDALTGWHTFRGTTANRGRPTDVNGPGPEVEPAWETTLRSSGDWRSLSVAGGVIFVGDERGIEVVDAADGAERAENIAGEHGVTTQPVVVDGRLYVGTDDSRIVSLDPTTGAEHWQARTTTETQHDDTVPIPVRSTPAVADERVFLADASSQTDRRDAIVRCYEATGGEKCWWQWPTVGYLGTGPPRYTGGRVVLDEGRELVALSLDDQSIEWRVPLAETDRTEARWRELAPAVADGIAAVATGDGLVGVDVDAGERIWTVDARGPTPDRSRIAVTYTPAIDDGVVYAGFGDGRFGAFDLTTGAERWTATPDPPVVYWTAPAVGHGGVFVGAQGPQNTPASPGDRNPDDARVYAFDAETGDSYGPWELPDHVGHPVVTDEHVALASGSSLYAFG